MSQVAWYTYDEEDASDKSGNGFHGTPSGVAWVSGLIGGAGSFSKNNSSKITLPASNAIFTASAPWTIACWFQWSGVHSTNGNHYITFFKDASNPALTLYVNASALIRYIYHNGSTTAIRTIGTATAGVWYHATLTYDGTTYSYYHNGTLADSVTATFSGFGSAAAIIGNYTATATTRWWNGLLDDVRFHSGVMPVEEILAIVNHGRGTAELEPWQRTIQPVARKLILPAA